jgi:hypothetical protein
MGDQSIARPVPTQENPNTVKAYIHQCPEWDYSRRFQCSSGREQYTPLGPSATAIGLLHLRYEFLAIIPATEIYEEKSVNRSEMDIKPKICDIPTCKNIYISTYPLPTDIFVPSLYQFLKTRNIEIF